MQKNEIEKLIDNKIKDVQLELSEKRFELSEKRMKFALSLGFGIGVFMLTVFGVISVIVPLVITDQSSDRVDQAIKDMKENFDKLAGTQLREPEIKVYLDGQEFKTGVLTFVIGEEKSYRFLVSNVGDRMTESVSIRVYTKSKEEIYFNKSKLFGTDFLQGDFDVIDLADEKGYPKVYQLTAEKYLLQPKDSFSFDLSGVSTPKTEMKTSALLKIIYDREPLKIPFEIVIEKK